MTITQAMVLAAGLGTRMRPITDTIPKPLVKVAGKPLVDYALDLLEEGGVTRVVANVHHHADQMEAHLRRRGHPEILISDEREQLMNRGGGAKRGFGLLQPGPVLLMNSDLFWIEKQPGAQGSVHRLSEFFDPRTMGMAMLCVPPEKTTGHDGTKDFHLGADGRLQRYRPGMDNPVVFAGLYATTTDLLDDKPDEPFDINPTFDALIAQGRLFGLKLEGHWITAGTPEAIGEAEEAIRRFSGNRAA